MSVAASDILSSATSDPTSVLFQILKKEYFDPDVMKAMLNDDRFSLSDRNRLKKYFKHRSGSNEVIVSYNYGKGYEDCKLGRVYPQFGLGLQSFAREMRNPLLAKYYWDIDIENAHYIFAQKLADEKGIKTEYMKYYIQNREQCLSALSSNRSIAKNNFLKILYGGDISLYDPYIKYVEDPDGDRTLLRNIEKEVNALMEIVYTENENIRKKCLKKYNPKASVLSIVLQEIEKNLLFTLDTFFSQNNRYMGVFIHDGGTVLKLEGETSFPTSLLKEAEHYLLDKTGYSVHLVNKPLEHSYSIPKQTIYVAEGVSLQAFQDKKNEFELNHFFLKENCTICEIKENGSLQMIGIEQASKVFANVCFEYIKDTLIKKIPFLPLWLSSSNRRQYDKLVYKPNGTSAENEFNTFIPMRASRLSPEGGEKGLQRFKDITLNLANHNVEHCDYLFKWMALKLQKPWVIPGVCLVFTGDQGIGKSKIWQLLGKCIIGYEQYQYTEDIVKDLFDTHSTAQMSKLFCFIEESSYSINRKMANLLKAKITAETATINPKGLSPFQIDTYMSYVMASNDITAVKVENKDRRYAIFYTGNKHKDDHAYWSETTDLFAADETAAAVYQFLMNIDLTGFIVQKFPVTFLREIMLENERSPEEMFLIEMANTIEGDAWEGTNKEFYKLYSDWCNRYEMRPKSLITLSRDLAVFFVKGWIANIKYHSDRGKNINLTKIRSN